MGAELVLPGWCIPPWYASIANQAPKKSAQGAWIKSEQFARGTGEFIFAGVAVVDESGTNDLIYRDFGDLTASMTNPTIAGVYRADTKALIVETFAGVAFNSATTFTRPGGVVIDTPDGYTEITIASNNFPNFRFYRWVAYDNTSKDNIVIDDSPYGYIGSIAGDDYYARGLYWSDTTTDTFDPPAGYTLTDCADSTSYNTNPDTYQKVSFPLTEDVAPDLAVDSNISTLTIWNVGGDPDDVGRGDGFLRFSNVTVQDSTSGSLCVERKPGNYGLTGSSHWSGGDMIQCKRITTAAGPDFLIDTWIRTDTDLDDINKWVNAGNTWVQFQV